MRRSFLCLSLVVVTMVIPGCAQTKLTNSWTDKDFHSPGYHKILVAAITDSPTTRRAVEEEFSKQIKARKAKEAVSSAILLPHESDLERAKVARVSRENGFDAVLAIQLLEIGKKTRIVGGHPGYSPYAPGYLGVYDPVFTPGYVVQHEVIFLETTLYDVESERLVWSGITETFNPSSTSKLIDELAAVVLERMDKDKVL